VRDPRIDNLARILVGYSTRVGEGDTVAIDGASPAEPLLQAVYEEVLKAGGLPVLQMTLEGQDATFYGLASDQQLDWLSPISRWAAEDADVRISVGASTNPRELSSVPPERQQRRSKATGELMATVMERSAEGGLRWVYTLFPTAAYAAEANMSRTEYEDFYFGACLADGGDPLRNWEKASEETQPLADWMEDHSEVHVVADGTDIKLGITGRKFVPSLGRHNMPDGEFFTGPVEDSVEGEVTFHLPAMLRGREVAGVRLRFEGGKVVDASAERGEEYLVKLLDTDSGARCLGELGIGTNYGIDRGTREVLLDEKIGGTVHMALGRSYPETGGLNESAVHEDLVCDLRQGGRVTVDGQELQVDGKFVV
jgi:aminopeptidase